MGKFLTELDIRALPPLPAPWWRFWGNPRRFELLAPLVYQATSGRVIAAPKGFITDGASVPRLFWSLLSPTGVLFKGAVVHDYLYSSQCRAEAALADITRREADEILREASQADGASALAANAAHAAVAAAGWMYWQD